MKLAFLFPLICAPVLAAESPWNVKPDATLDQSQAIQSAFDAMEDGEVITVKPGIYRYSKRIWLRVPNTRINARGALFWALDPDNTEFRVNANGVTVTGIAIDVYATYRTSNQQGRCMSIEGTSGAKLYDVTLREVTLSGCSGAGVLIKDAIRPKVEHSIFWRTWADAIHITNGTQDAVIRNNHIFQTGDDGIAQVAYYGGSTITGNVIDSNVIQDQYWGRGISCLGCNKAIIRNNVIAGTVAACVYVGNEWGSYKTNDSADVDLIGNNCQRVQATPPRFSRKGYSPVTGHGAYTVISQPHGPDDLTPHASRIRFDGNIIGWTSVTPCKIVGGGAVADVDCPTPLP